MFNLPTRYRILFVAAVAIAGVSYGLSLRPQPQSAAYHDFADRRAWLGMPNFADVASNVLFLLAGAYGLYGIVRRRPWQAEFQAYVWFFTGVVLTCFGSAYYHWAPTTERLMWDRLPMAVAFMGLLSATLGERVARQLGKATLYPLLFLGFLSVLLWRWSESIGRGDLRLYLAVQFLGLLLVLLMVLLFSSPYTRSGLLLLALGVYAVAKLCESNDRPLLDFLGISGHTLKHILAASAIFLVAHMVATRQRRAVARSCPAHAVLPGVRDVRTSERFEREFPAGPK